MVLPTDSVKGTVVLPTDNPNTKITTNEVNSDDTYSLYRYSIFMPTLSKVQYIYAYSLYRYSIFMPTLSTGTVYLCLLSLQVQNLYLWSELCVLFWCPASMIRVSIYKKDNFVVQFYSY